MKNIYFLKVPTFRKTKIIITCIIILLGWVVVKTTPAYAQWTPKKDAHVKRSEIASVVYKNKVYCFLGFDSTLNVINSSEVYDPALNKWTLLAEMPQGKTVTHQGVALIDGKVWHIGGRVGRNPGRLTSEIWIYDIQNNTWEPGPQLKDPATGIPLQWGGGGAVLVGRTLHVFGGFVGTACQNDQNKYHLTLNVDKWLEDPQNAVWENKRAPLPVKRNHFGTVVMSGKIYAIGGQFGHDCGGGQDQSYSHVYNPITNTWKELTRMPKPRSHIEGGIFPLDGKIYIVAGQGASNKSQDRVTVFSPEANNGLGEWNDEVYYKLPFGYEGVSAKVIGNTFIISHGGVGNSNGTRKETYTAPISRNIPHKLGFVTECFDKTLNQGKKISLQNLLYTLEGEKQFNITSSADWLKITKNASGVALPTALYIGAEIDATNLTPGNYSATITANGTGNGPNYSGASFCVNIKVNQVATSYSLTTNTTGNGTITTYPDQANYSSGTDVEVMATADPGHKFIGWGGDAAGKDNPLLVTMNEDKNIIAHFEPLSNAENLITSLQSDSSQKYILSILDEGMPIYTDRSYYITNAPNFLKKASFIQVPNNDKRNTNLKNISFKLTKNANVYVGYDSRAEVLPAWLKDWEKLPDFLNVTDATITYLNLYRKKFPAGLVHLGGNMAPPARGAENNYIIAAQEEVPASNLVISPNQLIFSSLKDAISEPKTLFIKNEGTAPVSITSTSLTGTNANAFVVADMPETLAAGESALIKVSFKPGSETGYLEAALLIISHDKSNGTKIINLSGLSTTGWEGANEPTLANVVKALGYNINVGWTSLTNNTSSELKGDEIAAPYFTKAKSGEVTITPVARFSPNQELPFGFYTKNGNSLKLLSAGKLSGASGQHQTLFPQVIPDITQFNPDQEQFGLYVQGLQNRVTYTEDALNPDGPTLHAVRIYPLKNRQGMLVDDNYLVCFEDASNGDYQDYVFVISNVVPVQINNQVVSFTLVNVDTEQDILTLTEGATINLASLATRNLNIRANTNNKTGSVVFDLNGKQKHVAVENIIPYALFGGNNYNAWTPAVGDYTLKATAYNQVSGTGSAGGTLLIKFNVVDEATTVNRETTTVTTKSNSIGYNSKLLTYPNPIADGSFNVLLPDNFTGEISYVLMSETGAIIKQGKYSGIQLSRNLSFNFSQEMSSAGVYYMKINGNNLNKTLKLIRL